jgi:cytochrome c553
VRPALLSSLALFAGALLALPAHAAEGNAADGRIKAYTCAGCHGITGYRNAYPSYRVPKIHGQNHDYLVAALTAYRAGERSHPTMQAQGESLTDQDIADLAVFLSTTPAAVAAQ